MSSNVQLDSTVEPTDVTFRWIVENLDGKDERWDRLRANSTISNLDFKLVLGAGFVSHVSHVVISFHDKTFAVFLKVPTTVKLTLITQGRRNGFEEQIHAALFHYHNQEIRFYDLIARHCKLLYLPQMYAFELSDSSNQQHGRVMFEDVADRGVMANVMVGLTVQQTLTTIENVAKLHAFTRYMPNSSEILRKMAKVHRMDMTDRELSIQERLQQLNVEFFANNKHTYQKLFDRFHLQAQDPHKQFDVPAVLSHGDLWVNNLLFCPAANRKPTDKLFTIIDWQGPYLSHGMNDLARLLFVSCSALLLRNETDRFLAHYYETFARELRTHGLKVGYDFELMKKMFKSACPHEYIFAVSFFSTLAHPLEKRDRRREGLIQRLIAGFEMVREEVDSVSMKQTD